MKTQHIIILGGYGTYGKLISENLSRTSAKITIVGRNSAKGGKFAEKLGVNFARCDISDGKSLEGILSDGFLVINASGPFSAGDYSIPQIAVEMGCHYIDLGDGRTYVSEITQLDEKAKEKGVFICVGASTSPAISFAMVKELKKEVPDIHSIKIALNAGNKNQAGVSTFESILAYVGRPIQVWQNRVWEELIGWSQGEFVDFPKPVGKRRVQLCDVPDLALFSKFFNAENVIFKAGVEISFFNYALSFLAKCKEISPSIDLPALAHPLVHLSGLFKSFGTFHGGLAVWVKNSQGKEKTLSLIAPQDGPQIPAAPTILLARKILENGIPKEGAFPCVGFLDFNDFKSYLSQFGIKAVQGKK